MLTLKNVGKVYKSKGSNDITALKDVNLSFGNCGMVFVLGKSGSGKSTLLNLLGGLDSPTEGEIFVDGASMRSFKQRDYDSYRNSFVGFVFQDYNLLEDFDVAENVEFVLQLSDENNKQKVIQALEEVELTSEYLHRRISELSGGEKQRVAIARAIVKDSKIILADEPTGNLDSATGESVWKILKKISQEKLVVVVTHDRQSAESYGDKIIEIVDGKIVMGDFEAVEEIPKQFSAVEGRLSFGSCMKMGLGNLKVHKVKSISVILLSVFTVLALLLAQMCLCFSAEKTLASFMKRNGNEYFSVMLPYSTQKEKDFIVSNSCSIKGGSVESKQDLLDMGLEFLNDKALELDEASFYISDIRLRELYQMGAFVTVGENREQFLEEIFPQSSWESLVGCRFDSYFGENMTLAGIVDTSKLSICDASLLPMFFAKNEYEPYLLKKEVFNRPDDENIFTISLNGFSYRNQFSLDVCGEYSNDMVLTPSGLKTVAEAFGIAGRNLSDDEVVLTYELYSQIFPSQSKWYYVASDYSQVKHLPTELGKRFSLKFFEEGTGELIVDMGEFKLAGIVFASAEDLAMRAGKNNLFVNYNTKEHLSRELGQQVYIVRTDSVRQLTHFLEKLRFDYNANVRLLSSSGGGNSLYSSEIYGAEEVFSFLKIVFAVLCAILCVVLILFVINLISLSIVARTKEIGVLMALGTRKSDLYKIFLIETLAISVVTLIVNLGGAFLMSFVFNRVLSSFLGLELLTPFVMVSLATVVTLLVSAAVLPMLAALVSIGKITKMKPIDAIKATQ